MSGSCMAGRPSYNRVGSIAAVCPGLPWLTDDPEHGNRLVPNRSKPLRRGTRDRCLFLRLTHYVVVARGYACPACPLACCPLYATRWYASYGRQFIATDSREILP